MTPVNAESSLGIKVEELFVQWFNGNVGLKGFPSKHWVEDDQAETPDIVIKAVTKILIPHRTDKTQRLHRADLEITVRMNIGKGDGVQFDRACNIADDLLTNIEANAATIAALPAFAYINLQKMDDEEEGVRDHDDKRRLWTRKISLVVQEKN